MRKYKKKAIEFIPLILWGEKRSENLKVETKRKTNEFFSSFFIFIRPLFVSF